MLVTAIDLVFAVVIVGLFAPGPEGAMVRRMFRFLHLVHWNESVTPREYILEERESRNGYEIVSRVNYSQLARVRRIRGMQTIVPMSRQPWRRPRQPVVHPGLQPQRRAA